MATTRHLFQLTRSHCSTSFEASYSRSKAQAQVAWLMAALLVLSRRLLPLALFLKPRLHHA